MNFDTFEKNATTMLDGTFPNKFETLNKELAMDIKFGGIQTLMPESRYDTLIFENWIGSETAALLASNMSSVFDTVHGMYSGVTLENGLQTLGLKEISKRNLSDICKMQNIKQQAGFVAEVIGTAKENLAALAEGSDIRTFRADDLPDLFKKNDQYVDKVRLDGNGNILEKIQVKFVGKDGADCLSKLASKEFDKYFLDGKVDKVEIPKDYYDQIRNENQIQNRLNDLQRQLDKVTELGKTNDAEFIQRKIDRFNKIDEMIERSTVSSNEAISARLHPLAYVNRIIGESVFREAADEGIKSGLGAAAITAAVSTVDNVQKVLAGEETAADAFKDVAKDTGVATVIAGGSAFVVTAVAETMRTSSHELIKSIGGSALPAAVVSFGVQSFDTVVDYAKGDITGGELANKLGENAVKIGGSMAGVALASAALASAPAAGAIAGTIVGGMVGTALAGEAYKTAVAFGEKNLGPLAEKLQANASATLDHVKESLPEKVSDIKDALNKFAADNDLPFGV